MVGLVIGITRFAWDSAYARATCGHEDERPSIIRDVHYLHFAILLFAVVTAVTVIISLLTKPIDDKHASHSLMCPAVLLCICLPVCLSVCLSVCISGWISLSLPLIAVC